jgi:aminoglycoside 6'-N-acetyltransferase I
MTSGKWQIEAPTLRTRPAWQAMRSALWPEMVEEDNLRETAMLSEKEKAWVRIALSAEGQPAGFAEATLRTDYVNGCETSPVAFLEGIYVEPWARRQGVAKLLVAEVERWALASGCREFASDALLENGDSHSMHRALGFEETERVVYFRKDLAS